jgi:hypothetical protein
MARALQNNPVGDGYVEINDTETLNVGGIQLATGVPVVAVLDEDNMASDSDGAVPTQQSTKAYVDAVLTRKHVQFIGNSVIDSFPDTSGIACVWDYVVWRGSNVRAGTITACWHASTNTAVMNEVSTPEIGNTTAVTFSVGINIGTDELELWASISDLFPWNVMVNRVRLHTMP